MSLARTNLMETRQKMWLERYETVKNQVQRLILKDDERENFNIQLHTLHKHILSFNNRTYYTHKTIDASFAKLDKKIATFTNNLAKDENNDVGSPQLIADLRYNDSATTSVSSKHLQNVCSSFFWCTELPAKEEQTHHYLQLTRK